MQNIKDLTLEEITNWIESIGEKPYKSSQIFTWVFNRAIVSFDEMTDIKKDLRERLKADFYISSPNISLTEKSDDGTTKLLLELEDKNFIECVLIPEENRLTLCISSQAGCPLDCGFCMTAKAGFARDLKLSEMIDQVFAAQSILSEGQKITNLVLMGMGEPLLNYKEVLKFLYTAVHPKGLCFAQKRITLSTAGIIPMIDRLGKDVKINLAVSLNATTDEVRTSIMPVNKKYPLKLLIEACKKYPIARNRHITFEYVLIEGINDSPEDARRLSTLLKEIKCIINLIPFNPFSGCEFKRPKNDAVAFFQKILQNNKFTAIIRQGKGQDISAACGQLKGRITADVGSVK